MKQPKKVVLSFIFFLISTTIQADHFPVGTDVLANCHGFFARGKVKKLYKERYVVHFYKDARPVHCTPFAWDSMFLVAYEPIEQHIAKLSSKDSFFRGSKEEVLKTGDKLNVSYKASIKGRFLDKKATITVAIKEINANGAAQLEIVDGELEAKQIFQRWVGTNYVTMDFSSLLKADRLTILKVEKK
ncbi:MAG: hypothetical protein KAH20_03135 [Methylococcales bacterium]|nr:hypothetical protein [Methylococcales bacterium]